MQSLKKMVRSSYNPVVQISLRDSYFIVSDGIAFVPEKRDDSTLVANAVNFDDATKLFECPCGPKLINITYVERTMITTE